jgi:hypothetical protein
MSRTDLLPFTFKDQFNAPQNSAGIPADHLIIILGGDKDGSKPAGEIAKALLAELHARKVPEDVMKKIHWLPVADLGIVPSFARRLVRMFLPSNPDEKVALDWDGTFSKTYRWQKSVANIMLFGKGPERKLVYSKALGSLGAEDREKIVGLMLESVVDEFEECSELVLAGRPRECFE